MEETKDSLDEDSPEYMAARLRELFREEAYELIAELESAVLEIEKTPNDREQIGRVFRAMHTIKGSGAACGLDDVASFTHEIETFYDLVRKGKISLNREIIDLTLAARDQIKAMLDACYYEGTTDEAKGRRIIAAFKKSIAGEEAVRKDALPSRQEEAQSGCRARPAPEEETNVSHQVPSFAGHGCREARTRPSSSGTCASSAPVRSWRRWMPFLLPQERPAGRCCWSRAGESMPFRMSSFWSRTSGN